MSNSIDKLIDGMPYPILTRISGVPAYNVIKIINNELIGNAVTVPTNLGYGTVGYTYLTLMAANYANISIAA